MPARLKSLELVGYKTFASKTVFEFAGTVTAIVGPNGSGKSNIADSLRWVLGEQSFSLLRGKKTEDMIFAGSEHRPRAGMASATIVFDNSDGWLPIDFSEVAISRRAYRDGENEYFLNGQRIRLRDVSELLAQSGLAERTYTIIGQGLVDAALALKAEERRRLFEEAAGIGLHRTRKEEALKRLETTRRNLDRVQDILAEIQPRLRSLERQARRVQEYEQVKADLRLILREWYGFHWHAAQKELAIAREAARREESSLNKVRDQQQELNQVLDGSRQSVQALRLRLGEWQRQLSGLLNQREAVARSLAIADERGRSFQQQEENTREELTRLEEEIGYHQERLENADEELSGLIAEQQEARQQAAAARQALQKRQVERAEADKKVQSARQTLSGLTARQAHLQARLQERQAQAQRQAGLIEKAAQALAAAEKDVQSAGDLLKKLALTRDETRQAAQAAAEALQNGRKQLTNTEAERRDLLEARARRDAEAVRLKAQLDVLDQAEKSLTGYGSGAKLLIEAARQARLKGTRGALSSFLDVPAELETAIAAALGEYLEAVVLDQAVVAEDALRLLEGKSSRAVLLPIENLRAVKILPDGVQDTFTDQEVYGLASELVSVPQDLRPALNFLLGQVWVVCDREVARRLLQYLHDNQKAAGDTRVVTLRGEVFHMAGPIVAGQEDKPAALSRPRQRKELRQEFEMAQARLKELDEQIRELDTQRLKLRTHVERLEQEAGQKRKAEELARSAVDQQDLALEKARRQLAWQREQRANLESDQRRGESEAGQITTELTRLEGEIQQAREALRESNAGLASLSLDELQTQLTHWNTRLTVAERAASEAEKRRQERRSTLERANQRRLSLLNRLEDGKQSLENLGSEKTKFHRDEEQIAAQIETLQVQVQPAQAELNSAELEQARLEEQESEARQALSIAEHHHAQARINLVHRQEELDSLHRRIEDDFGLVAFEFDADISGQAPLPIEGMVEQLPVVHELSADIEEALKRQRAQLRRMGPINPEAQTEYLEVKQRYQFLTEQVADLQKAESDIQQVIAELDTLMQREFRKTFEAVSQEFKVIFTRLFGGGSARLLLTDPDDLTNTGIDIEARLPGRRTQGLSLLSGGERSLTATALVFALLKVSPTPFCVFDEVDAMLDEANVGRFRDLLRELSDTTQFVVVTHNRNTVQAADVIYGVTMGADSASQVLSLKLDEISRVVE